MSTYSTHQKALHLLAQNGEYVIKERAIPKVLPGHIVVKIHSAALNPSDWKIRNTGFFVKSWPAILGTDGAGTVEEIGEDVVQWKKGDRVFFQGYFEPDKGCYQQYTLVPADIVGRIPESISFDQAATIPVALTAAVAGLYQYKGSDALPPFTPPYLPNGEGKYAGKPIIILGGSTSVAIQFAKLSGFSPIIATASLRHESLLKSLGATHVLDRSSPSLVSDISTILSSLNLGKPSIVYDAVSDKDTQETGLELLAPSGVLVIVNFQTVDKEKVEREGKHVFLVIGSSHLPQLRDFGYLMWAELPRLIEGGKIKPNNFKVVPDGLYGIADGLQQLEQNKVSGMKLVAHPFDTLRST